MERNQTDDCVIRIFFPFVVVAMPSLATIDDNRK